MAPGGRPVLGEQPGLGRHLSPATMDSRMPRAGAAAGREWCGGGGAEKGRPPGRLLATEAEEPGVGGERRKDDRCCRCVRAPQGSLQAGGKQAGAHAIARDARHRGGTAACERRGSRRPSWGGKGAGAAEETPGQHQHSRPLQGGGAWGLGARASRAAPPGVQACDRGEGAGPEPPRCPGEQARCLSPRPCRKGGQGRVAAEAPAAGPAYAGRLRRVVAGASREAGTGRSGAIGTWGGWRLGV